MRRLFDLRTLLIMLAALGLGLAWAGVSLAATGGLRNDTTARALVWVVCAAPLALFLGWLAARRLELGLAALCCFCLYFFTFFVAQHAALIAGDPGAYFVAALATHALAGTALALWRAAR
jgi:hypothetical protein